MENGVAAGLVGGAAGEVFFGPDEPSPHALIFGEGFVGAGDGTSPVSTVGIAQDQHGAGFGISAALESYNHAILNFFLLPQRRFEILGIDVHSGGRDDHFFFAALEKKIALLI